MWEKIMSWFQRSTPQTSEANELHALREDDPQPARTGDPITFENKAGSKNSEGTEEIIDCHSTEFIVNQEYAGFGVSVRGTKNKKQLLPCQDAHSIDLSIDNAEILIVSDGAGSAKLSHKSSEFCCKRLMDETKALIVKHNWHQEAKLPDETVWKQESVALFCRVRKALENEAAEKGGTMSDYNCTLILLIRLNQGFLLAHVGDGRAGFCKDNEYYPLMIPFQTHTAGHTVFLATDYWEDFFRTSRFEVETPDNFFVISDGCQRFSFLLNSDKATHIPETTLLEKNYNHPDAFYDLNVPFKGFYAAIHEYIVELNDTSKSENISDRIANFLDSGLFKGQPVEDVQREDDDKTMCMVISMKN
jgi:hypothetical protein